MPRRDGSLTKGELVFLDEFSRHRDRDKAERAAGLAPRSGYSVLARPEIQRQLVAGEMAKITSEALPVAVETLLEVMRNAKAPAAARVQAAKVVLDRTLGQGESGQAKELHEMTPEELAQAINVLETKAASMAKPVASAQENPDIFG